MQSDWLKLVIAVYIQDLVIEQVITHIEDLLIYPSTGQLEVTQGEGHQWTWIMLM